LIKRILPLTFMATRRDWDFASACNPGEVSIGRTVCSPASHHTFVRTRLGAHVVGRNIWSIQTSWYVAARNYPSRCDQPLLGLPGGRRDRSQPAIFLIPVFHTFTS